jgi:hypothetical protein
VHNGRVGHPDLAPSDFHLFPKLKEFLGGRCFTSSEEVKDAIKQWLNGLVIEVYGIQKLITGYDKCLNGGGKSGEKYLRVCYNDTIFLKFLFCLYFFIAKQSFLSG